MQKASVRLNLYAKFPFGKIAYLDLPLVLPLFACITPVRPTLRYSLRYMSATYLLPFL